MSIEIKPAGLGYFLGSEQLLKGRLKIY